MTPISRILCFTALLLLAGAFGLLSAIPLLGFLFWPTTAFALVIILALGLYIYLRK